MLSRTIIEDDAFMELPNTARFLYVYLTLNADDDGLVSGVRLLSRMIGSTKKDVQRLVDIGYLLPLSDRVMALTHWHVANTIRKDCYHPSVFEKEKSLIKQAESKIYVYADVTNPLRVRNETVTQLDKTDKSDQLEQTDKQEQTEQTDEKMDIESASDNAFESEFESVWSLYPKKIGHDEAFEAFKDARKNGVPADLIREKINEYLTHIDAKNTEYRFIKNGGTWFKSRGWIDEYDTAPERNTTPERNTNPALVFDQRSDDLDKVLMDL